MKIEFGVSSKQGQRYYEIILYTFALALALGKSMPTYAQECDPVEAVKLLANDGFINDYFGFGVSLSGDTAAISAYGDDSNGLDFGSVYIYTRLEGMWSQQAELFALDGATDEWFGRSVSISGDTVVVGASRDDDNGVFSGSVYVFKRDDGVWKQQAKLIADDGEHGDNFGNSVSICDDIIVVGASGADNTNGSNSGAAYIFTCDGSTWTQQAKLLPDDGAEGDSFGNSVSISGSVAVIGSYKDDGGAQDSGSAYIYSRSESKWIQQAKLVPNDLMGGDWFGRSVSVSGDTILVGAVKADACYVYVDNEGVWTQQSKLQPTDVDTSNSFGISVSVNNDTAVVGAFFDGDNGIQAGSVYVYSRIGKKWISSAKLLASDGESGDWFGYSVSASYDEVIVGAWQDDDNGFASGSAALFNLGCTSCIADLNGDSQLDFFDISIFLNAYSTHDSIADLNEDGSFDITDISVFIASYENRCS